MTLSTESGKAFDQAAGIYDRDAAENPMMRWLRGESLRPLLRYFRPGDRVVEIGCGTGEEVIALARRGVWVLATDASAGMIEVVRSKAGTYPGGLPNLTTRVLPAGEMGRLVEEYGEGSFRGAFSSLGALNCTPDLSEVARALSQLVTPGGAVVLSLLAKYCLWETLWYLAARKPGLAFRRWSGYARGTALPGGPQLDVYYWPLREIERAFSPYFRIRKRKALPWALPPTYAAGFLGRHPRLFRALARLERATGHLWPFYALGDHVHLTLIRRDT